VSNATKPVVLYVDNNSRRLLARRFDLSIAGYDVLPAISGAAAWRLFRRRPVDLVITDHRLPGISGTEVTAYIKDLKHEVPVILLIEGRKAPPGAGRADLVLAKDTDLEELLTQAEKLLRRRQLPPPPPPSRAKGKGSA